MDKEALVYVDLQGKPQKLDESGLPIQVAMWFFMPEINEWRLLFASPEVLEKGSGVATSHWCVAYERRTCPVAPGTSSASIFRHFFANPEAAPGSALQNTSSLAAQVGL